MIIIKVNNYKKRKLFKALIIKEQKPSLNEQTVNSHDIIALEKIYM